MEQLYRQVISGRATGIGAAMLRGFMRCVEPIYTAIVTSRNSSYSKGILRSHRINRPVVSVGNITTGGTGKTPVVRWLSERLRAAGLRPAVLMRGYQMSPGGVSDEQQLLRDLLNPIGSQAAPIVVHADRNRAAGAQAVLREHPDVDVFILDDGFQHRRLQRDFDLVLIDATNPFGYEHVLPRGLLREPLRGLRRAHAIVLTRFDQALPSELADIEEQVRRFAPIVPVYRSRHAHAALVVDEAGATRTQEVHQLRGRRVFAFCGIGNPEAFERQLHSTGARLVGHHWFADHHDYSESDLALLRAESSVADAMVTTEKDWVKLARLPGARNGLPILRVRLEVTFEGNDEQRLFEQIQGTVLAKIES